MLTLNHQQREARDLILNCSHHVFVSGFAGTGKTVLLNRLIQDLRSRGEEVRVTAFTGLAAQHLQGTTIAKLLGLGLSKGLADMEDVDLDRAASFLDGVTTLFVDEISMNSGDYLELMDAVMQEATGRSEPFGGIRLIFGGDFMQLPPVLRAADRPPKLGWAFEYPEFSSSLAIFLTENMRQRNTEDTELLNQFRQGIISPRGRAALDAMVGRQLENPVALYPLRREVDALNQARLTAHPGAVRDFPTHCSSKDQERLLLGNVPVRTNVQLKVGAPVIILMNDPDEKFVNGSQGHVRRFLDGGVEVTLNSGRDVQVPYKLWHVKDPLGQSLGTVRGLPVQLGWAATIHRAQGMTLDAVTTDISRCWEPGQAYVALSRTRSLNHVSLLKPAKRIKVDPIALAYVNRLF